jgi:hypothetical protein
MVLQGSHSSAADAVSLLGCDSVSLGALSLTFKRNMVPHHDSSFKTPKSKHPKTQHHIPEYLHPALGSIWKLQ